MARLLSTTVLLGLLVGCGSKPFISSEAGAGGDGGTGDDASSIWNDSGGPIGGGTPTCPGKESSITGTVFAPNGTDPVPGATVFIPSRVPELFPPDVKCEVCGTYGNSTNLWFGTSKFDGTFELKNVCPGKYTLVFQNGRFRRVIEVNVPPSGTLKLTVNETRLPRRTGEAHKGDSIPKMAVATGDYDKMECVLRKLGIQDDQFDLYEGAKVLVSPTKKLTPFKNLVGNLDLMKKYAVIFINCTDNTFEDELKKTAVRDNIEAYVNAGGRLYITDWSYDWMEQITGLAPFVDFQPDDSGEGPEGANAGALGADGLKVQATIKDPNMAQWLALFPGTITGDKVLVQHFLVEWVMMRKLGKDVKLWVEGDVKSKDGKVTGTLPLTVTYNFKNCGKILFSSYHTEGRDTEWLPPLYPGLPPMPNPKPFPEYCSAQMEPQDRILEYLIYDISNCIKPIDKPAP